MEERKDEITLKELIEKLKEYALHLWEKKVWILLSVIVFSLILGLKAYFTPITYRAELTFMVNDDEGGSMGGIGAILGQFGLGGGGGKYNYEKILEIARSNRIVDQVLMDSATIGDKNDLIANHIIDVYDLHKTWNNDTALNNFVFSHKNTDEQKENLARKILIAKYLGTKESSKGSLASITFNEESTIMNISTATENEDLSISIALSWYDKLSTFYVKKSTERHQITYQTLSNKADSIYRLLSESESSLAANSEKRGLVLASDYLPRGRSSRNIEMYGAMYAEVVKNKETAEFILKSETPFFQIIDSPLKPLDNGESSLIISLILGGIIGGIISVVVIIVTNILKNILSE